MYDTCTTYVRQMYDTCTTHVRHVHDTCTTHLRQMYDKSTKHIRHTYDFVYNGSIHLRSLLNTANLSPSSSLHPTAPLDTRILDPRILDIDGPWMFVRSLPRTPIPRVLCIHDSCIYMDFDYRHPLHIRTLDTRTLNIYRII